MKKIENSAILKLAGDKHNKLKALILYNSVDKFYE